MGGWGATVNTSSRDAPRLERRAASEVRGKAVARARVWKWTVTRARVYGSGSRRGATRGLRLGIARVASAHLVRPGAPMKLQVLRDERRELRLHRLILHDPIQRHIRVRLHAGHGVGCARVAARLGGRRCPRAPEVCSRARGRFQSRTEQRKTHWRTPACTISSDRERVMDAAELSSMGWYPSVLRRRGFTALVARRPSRRGLSAGDVSSSKSFARIRARAPSEPQPSLRRSRARRVRSGAPVVCYPL